MGTKPIQAGSGIFLQVPIGVPHTFANRGSGSARLLNTFLPPRYLDYFVELGELAAAGPVTPDDGRTLMARYDTEVMELACRYFEANLQTREGASARGYLLNRRLGETRLI